VTGVEVPESLALKHNLTEAQVARNAELRVSLASYNDTIDELRTKLGETDDKRAVSQSVLD